MKKLKIKKTIILEEEIVNKCKEVANWIDLNFNEPTLVCLLKGSLPFFLEISKHMKNNHRYAFLLAKSYYGNFKTTGKTNILSDLDFDVKGHELIIVEDIVDSGRTLLKVKNHLLKKNPKSISLITLIDKKGKRVNDIEIDYSCFEVEDKFLIGFGLDYNELYRNLRYIAEAEEINE